jgi:ADP-ribose pyrophosphatase
MIYEGAILNLRKDKVTVKDGRTSSREIVEHNGGVVIAAITNDGKIPMVKQYRKAAEKAVLEIPAGKLEGDEDPKEAALRELKEETGYTANSIEHLTSFYSSIGYSEEVLHLYIAKDLLPGETDFDESEAIDIYEYSTRELLDMVMNGQIEDAKTIIAIFYLNTLT